MQTSAISSRKYRLLSVSKFFLLSAATVMFLFFWIWSLTPFDIWQADSVLQMCYLAACIVPPMLLKDLSWFFLVFDFETGEIRFRNLFIFPVVVTLPQIAQLHAKDVISQDQPVSSSSGYSMPTLRHSYRLGIELKEPKKTYWLTLQQQKDFKLLSGYFEELQAAALQLKSTTAADGDVSAGAAEKLSETVAKSAAVIASALSSESSKVAAEVSNKPFETAFHVNVDAIGLDPQLQEFHAFFQLSQNLFQKLEAALQRRLAPVLSEQYREELIQLIETATRLQKKATTLGHAQLSARCDAVIERAFTCREQLAKNTCVS